MAGTTFAIKQSFSDSAGPTWSGTQSIAPGTGGSNAIQVNQSVPHNASVVAANEPSVATYDDTIVGESLTVANITGMGFACTLVNANGATAPVCYIKLKGAITGTHDLIIPLTSGQAWTWVPTPSVPSLGASNVIAGAVQPTAATITSITVVPDVAADFLITGTIEVSS